MTSKGRLMEMDEAERVAAKALEDPGYVELTAAGVAAVGEFRCAECGYGAIVHGRLPVCPMCGGKSWEPSPWSPFTRSSSREPMQ